MQDSDSESDDTCSLDCSFNLEYDHKTAFHRATATVLWELFVQQLSQEQPDFEYCLDISFNAIVRSVHVLQRYILDQMIENAHEYPGMTVETIFEYINDENPLGQLVYPDRRQFLHDMIMAFYERENSQE